MATVQARPTATPESGAELDEILERKRRQFQKKLRTSLKAYLFIAPAVIILFVFHFAPIFYAFFLSLYERISVVKGLVPPAESFAGFNNYIAVWNDSKAWNAFWNTCGYVVGVVFFGLAAALGLALLLDKVRVGKNFYRTAFFLPYITSLVAAASVWNLLFAPYSSNALVKPNPNQPGGLVNWVFASLGIPMQRWLLDDRGIFRIMFANGGNVDWTSAIVRLAIIAVLIGGLVWLSRRLGGSLGAWATGIVIAAVVVLAWSTFVEIAHLWTWDSWFGGPSLAMVTMIIIAIWHSLGFNVVIILAGLTNVSRELYEAAKIDGAKGWSMFTRMTIPLLSPTLFFLVIVGTIGAFQTFTLFFSIFGEKTNVSTTVLSIFYYQVTFTSGSGQVSAGFGYASTIVMFMLILIMSISFIQQQVLGKRVNYD